MFFSTSPSELFPCGIIWKKKVFCGQGLTLSVNSVQIIVLQKPVTISFSFDLPRDLPTHQIPKCKDSFSTFNSVSSICICLPLLPCHYAVLIAVSWINFYWKVQVLHNFFQNNFDFYETFAVLYIFYLFVWFLRPGYTI